MSGAIEPNVDAPRLRQVISDLFVKQKKTKPSGAMRPAADRVKGDRELLTP
jgi:hypothetical protein